MKFKAFNIKNEIIEALEKEGYSDLTPIQEKAIPLLLKKKSLICKSETGSGKTHSFLVPLLNNVDTSLNKIQALIICPTVILSNQTYTFGINLTKHLEGYKISLATSNNEREKNKEDLISNPCQILVGTPGRLFDILKEPLVDTKHIKTVVFDEADMLMDDNYKEDLDSIMDLINPEQRLIFTATMKEHELKWMKKYIASSEIIEVTKNKTNKNVNHHLVDLRHKDEIDSLIKFIDIVNPYFTLVFSSQKTKIKKVYDTLNKRGIKCALLTGDNESRDNKITLKRIKNGEFKLVLCSDLASRGIDIEDVSTVISLDLPKDLDYYYHRSGRTGRINKQGDSYIFYNEEDLKTIEKLLPKINFDYLLIKNDELVKVTISQPKKKTNSEELEKEIRKQVHKVKSNKVKPNYKKKRKQAVERAKRFIKNQNIKKNIRAQKKKNKENSVYR